MGNIGSIKIRNKTIFCKYYKQKYSGHGDSLLFPVWVAIKSYFEVESDIKEQTIRDQ